jgi:hypothetical protein
LIQYKYLYIIKLIFIKSDMYSLGIILFELLFPFKTEMERLIEINKLKNDDEYLKEKKTDLNNLLAMVRKIKSLY